MLENHEKQHFIPFHQNYALYENGCNLFSEYLATLLNQFNIIIGYDQDLKPVFVHFSNVKNENIDT